MTERVDCIVVGAGVVGLAVAQALARAGREVIVLEREGAIGTGISSRNSEVIHAGIYYPTGSLKAQLCVAGRQLLYRHCEQYGVEHRRIGKLIVATSERERPTLAKYEALARANGVEDLRPLLPEETAELEPNVSCVAALWSPSTGIVDSHGLMLSYQAELEARQGVIACNSPVLRGRVAADAVTLEVGGEVATSLSAATVVNCAGLGAQRISHSLEGLPAETVPPLYYAKGYYFSLAGKSPFHHLVYPLPNAAGLGTHVTLDLNGQARFGPDVQWISAIDYGFEPSRKAEFAAAIRLYYPELDEARLQPAYTGIRPKLASASQAAADFCIHGPAEHGGCSYVALYGIESPGLTASLAIAARVQALLR